MAFWDDLVAYYKCAGGNDSWGRYNVSLNNVEISDGIGPTFSSWDFATSGSSDKAAVFEPDAIPADTGIASVSMWFKGLQSGNGSGFVASNDNTLIHIASDELGIKVGGATSCGYDVTPIRGLSTWTHLAVTADGAGNYEYYINGSSVGSIAAGAVWADDIIRIGNFTGSDDEFADYITEFAVWSRVLTSDEIELIHSNGASGTRDLTRLIEPRQQLPDDKGSSAWINMSGNVLLWHLNDAGGGSEPDGSGDGHTGTPASVSNASGIMMHSASFSTSSAGTIFDNAASFNGSNSDIDAASAVATALGIDGNNSRTTMCWAKSDNWSNDDNLWAMGNNSTRQDWSLLARTNGFKLNTWSDDLTWDGMTSDEKDNWFHVAATYDGTTMRLYLNGTERATRTPGTLATADNYPLRVGNDHGYNGNPWDGLIQEFAMFDEALSDVDILSIYNTQNAFVSGAYGPSSGSVAVGAAFATVVHEGGTQAAVDSVFATVVHEGGTQAAVDSVFATVVHEGGTQAAVDSVFATVVHSAPTFLVPDITGTVGITASFDASSQGFPTGSTSYQWSWSSVPSGSSMANAILSLPDSGSTYPVSGNVGLWHFDSEASTLTPQIGSVGLVDSYGDGWHGANWVTVLVNSIVVVNSATLGGGPGPEWHNFTAADGDSVEVVYTSNGCGSPSWGSECSFILNSGSDGGGVSFYTSGLCPLPPATPYSFTANGFLSGTITTTPDTSGQGNDAIPDGAALVSSSYVGSHCYEFDGVDDSIDLGIVPSDIGIGGGNSRTIAFWASSSVWVNNSVFFSMGDDSNSEDFTFIQRTPSDVKLSFWNDDLQVTVNNSPGWHHYFLIYDSGDGNSYIYQDNLLLGSNPVNPNTIDAYRIIIGDGASPSWQGNYYEGKIDEFAIWDRALTSCERSTIYNFLQTGSIDAASGSSPNLLEQFSFVPDVTGTYSIDLEMVDTNNCTSLTGAIQALISPAGPLDCAGVVYGTAYTNSCGYCVEGTTGLPATYGQIECWDGSWVCTASVAPIVTGTCPVAPTIPCIESGSSDPVPFLGRGFVINNYKNLSTGRDRRVDQVPFKLGIHDQLGLRLDNSITTPSGSVPTYCTGS